jgi:hypothetical protein
MRSYRTALKCVCAAAPFAAEFHRHDPACSGAAAGTRDVAPLDPRIQFLIRAIPPLLLALLASLSPAYAAYPNGYGNCKLVTTQHAMVSGNSDLANYPLTVILSDADLKTTANGGLVNNVSGYDIGFGPDCSGTGTMLKWELESYAPTGAIVAHVLRPSLSHTTDDTIGIYYGAGFSSFQSTPVAVWDTNYQAVWHLPDGAALSVLDSTGKANNSVNNGATAVAGTLGGGAAANGSQWVNVGTSASLQPAGAFTLSAWVKLNSFASYPGLITSPYQANTAAGYILAVNTAGKLVLYTDPNGLGNTYNVATSANTMSAGVWYFVAGVWDGSTQRLYFNGAPDGTHAAPSVNYGAVAVAGRLLSYPAQNANGSIDEVRISNIARSPDWILTEFRNQNAPATYISVGPRLPSSIRIRHKSNS